MLDWFAGLPNSGCVLLHTEALSIADEKSAGQDWNVLEGTGESRSSIRLSNEKRRSE